MRADPFRNLDASAEPKRTTRNCSLCGRHEGPRGELRATQFLADPPNHIFWKNKIEVACQKCRPDADRFRIPSYHPNAESAPWTIKASQLAGGDPRAITLNEPWAWLIQQGYKDCENRTWRMAFSGRLFIHAGKRIATDFAHIDNFVGTHLGIILPSREWLIKHHAGRIVGVVDFAAQEPHIDSPWKMKGQWAWPIRWSWPITPTEPVRGALGLWRVNPEMVLNIDPRVIK